MHIETEDNWSRGKLKSQHSCPSCASNKPADMTFIRRDDAGSMPDQWRMLQCADCQSLWLDPRPDSASLPRAYEDYYTHNPEVDEANQSGGGFVWGLIHGYLNRRFGMQRMPANGLGYVLFSLIAPWRLKLDYYGRHLTREHMGASKKLLDIGCGNGAFLTRAVEMGWQVQGCEIDPKAVATCRSLGLNVVEGDAFSQELAEQSFDVITMSHVIEHVYDQPAVLKRAYDLLRPGGWLWVACPNPQSLGKKVFGTAWAALHPPYHLSIPTQAVLLKWTTELRFSNVQFIRRGAHARHIWRLSQAIAQREALPIPSPIQLFISRIVADTLASVSTKHAEETVFLAQKPE